MSSEEDTGQTPLHLAEAALARTVDPPLSGVVEYGVVMKECLRDHLQGDKKMMEAEASWLLRKSIGSAVITGGTV